MNAHALWMALQARGAVQGPPPPDHDVPWALRLLFGLGAWVASICVIGFIALLFNDLVRESAGRLTLAAFAGVGAWKLLPHGGQRPFLGQLGLVLACVMQGLLLLSIIDDIRSPLAASLMVLLIAALSFTLPSRLWRVWCTWLGIFGLAWLLRSISPSFGLPVALALVAGAAVWLWLQPAVMAQSLEWLWPLALGLSLGTWWLSGWNPGMPWRTLFASDQGDSALLTAALCSTVLAAVNAWLVLALARRPGTRPVAAVALVLLLSAATFSTPAIGAAVTLLLLGYGRAQPVLTVIGWMALPLAFSAHYYGLHWSLNLKALSMAALALLLLSARLWLLRAPAAGGRPHA